MNICVEILHVLPLHVFLTSRSLTFDVATCFAEFERFLHETVVQIFVLQDVEYCSLFCYKSCSWQLHLEKSTSVMAPVSYTEICKQLEGCYNPERITTEKEIDPEVAATHVRYYIPLTNEEYNYMLEEATRPKVATIKASTRMPLYDRVNGMLSADQCLPLLTYLYTEGKIITNSLDHFYVV